MNMYSTVEPLIKGTSLQGALFLSFIMLNDLSTKDTSIKRTSLLVPMVSVIEGIHCIVCVSFIIMKKYTNFSKRTHTHTNATNTCETHEIVMSQLTIRSNHCLHCVVNIVSLTGLLSNIHNTDTQFLISVV